MAQSRSETRQPLPPTDLLLSLVYGCPYAGQDRDCPLYGVRQMDRLTTLCYLRNLCDEDRLWIARRHAPGLIDLWYRIIAVHYEAIGASLADGRLLSALNYLLRLPGHLLRFIY